MQDLCWHGLIYRLCICVTLQHTFRTSKCVACMNVDNSGYYKRARAKRFYVCNWPPKVNENIVIYARKYTVPVLAPPPIAPLPFAASAQFQIVGYIQHVICTYLHLTHDDVCACAFRYSRRTLPYKLSVTDPHTRRTSVNCCQRLFFLLSGTLFYVANDERLLIK